MTDQPVPMTADPDALAGEKLQIHYVPLDAPMLWDENPKLHDLGAMAASIRKHGFRDAPIFDATTGQIMAGNGRITCLRWMRAQGENAPRGILVDSAGNWNVPVQFGIDSASQEAAIAFAVDHNNLTLMGGSLTLFDIARIWDSDYGAKVAQWAAAGVEFASLDGDDIDALSRYHLKALENQGGDEDTEREHKLAFRVEVGDQASYEDAVKAVRGLINEHPEWGAGIK